MKNTNNNEKEAVAQAKGKSIGLGIIFLIGASIFSKVYSFCQSSDYFKDSLPAELVVISTNVLLYLSGVVLIILPFIPEHILASLFDDKK